MKLDLQKLKALALAATKGPWDKYPAFDARPHTVMLRPGINLEFHHFGYDRQRYPDIEVEQLANMEFIAAANPQVVLELIEALEEARNAIALASPILNSVLDEGNWDGDRWASKELVTARGNARKWLEKYEGGK